MTDALAELMADIDRLHALAPEALQAAPEARAVFERFLGLLERGEARAAAPAPDGAWRVDARVKRGVLFGFKLGRLVTMGDAALPFVDKDTYPVRAFAADQRVRVVPGGTSVRRGAFVAPGVTIMPPAFVNVGAYVDEGAMIDSHALVGSCAQLGKRVHLSAAAQVGGVLEPVGALPVIIEDDCFIGGNCGIYEGTVVRARALLAAGVVLTRSSRLFDLVHEREITAPADGPLEVPAGAVVVAGSRPASGAFASERGLQVAAPIIVKYRDEKTEAKATLEAALRA